jgi:hypothetical protein
MSTARGEVLVLNKAYMPINVITWQEAICLWFTDKAEIISSYEDRLLNAGEAFVKRAQKEWQANYNDEFETWKHAMNMPAVIRVFEFIRPKKDMKFFKPFTRKNVYDRDHGICQYCGHPVSIAKFTFDHVKPRTYGGLTRWENIVCACLKCNSKKGGRTPEEAGMKVIQKPYAPKLADSFDAGVIQRMKEMPKMLSNKHWQDYIYWHVELKHD